MRNTFLTILTVGVIIGSGLAAVRPRKAPLSFKAHTIIYRLTNYDEMDKVSRTDIVVRQVFADGIWKHTQIEQNGTVHYTSGQLTDPAACPATSANTDSSSPELLNYKYVEDPCHDCKAWISPELQDFLMFTTLRADGSKETVLEAINITTP